MPKEELYSRSTMLRQGFVCKRGNVRGTCGVNRGRNLPKRLAQQASLV